MKGKVIALSVIIIYFVISYLINYHREKVEEENTRTVITEVGDEFIISTDTTLFHKTRLINQECCFDVAVHDHTPDDDIILLCNTQNVTVYELSNMKICRIKKYNRIITLGEYYEDDAYMYEYLNGVIEEDEEASCYLKEYLEKLQSDPMSGNSK